MFRNSNRQALSNVVAAPTILGPNGQPLARANDRWQETRRQAKRLQARYDAAQTTDLNSNHWAQADALSPKAANSQAVRSVLRKRSRYECHESNSLAKGICLTLANDTIGKMPLLQVLTDDPDLNQLIEAEFHRWARTIRLGAKLRTMRLAKVVDGEAFALMVNNDSLDGVTLDLKLLEADQVANPLATILQPEEVDGIRLDGFDNPDEYFILTNHPGDTFNTDPISGQWLPARLVFHWFREDRPGQKRGIPEITSALPLFAQLRRYTLAVISAAETAAEFAAVLQSDSAPLDSSEIADIEAMDAIDIERNVMMTLPMGWKIGQIKAEQPTTTYEQFRNAIINEMARCLNMPFNIAAGNSAGYNYSSGRLDHQVYHRALDVERSDLECCILDRLFSQWQSEASLVLDGIPIEAVPIRWAWPAHRHVDPAKEAKAALDLWNAGLLTDDQFWHLEGYDPETQYRNLERQMNRRSEIGAPSPGKPAAPAATKGTNEEDESKEEVEEGAEA